MVGGELHARGEKSHGSKLLRNVATITNFFERFDIFRLKFKSKLFCMLCDFVFISITVACQNSCYDRNFELKTIQDIHNQNIWQNKQK